jgi:aspartate kinase
MRVLKFGGSSLSSPDKILHVAKNVARCHAEGEALLLVVSAMGTTTDQLMNLAYQISPRPDLRELDMLLTTGERVSMALMAMALKDLGCSSISFTGSQAGILTDRSHFGARILDIKPTRVREALDKNQVVIVAGFQGVDPESKEITTLGRGGSDTSAVALAAALGAARCDLLKDIEGVASADPKLVPSAKKYSRLPLTLLNDMCFWGAKILHHRSVELALREGVRLGVGSSTTFRIGTDIIPDVIHDTNQQEEPLEFETSQAISVTSHTDVLRIVSKVSSIQSLTDSINGLLEAHRLPPPQVLLSQMLDGTTGELLLTSDKDHLKALQGILKTDEVSRFSSVTVTCFGTVSGNFLRKCLHTLSEAQISVEKVACGPLSITFLVLPAHCESAIIELHRLVAT